MNITIDTIMADKNKYETLVHVITELYPSMTDYQKEKLEGVCPELAESKDEMIRKALIELVRKHCVNETRCMLEGWLGKQKPVEWSEEDTAKMSALSRWLCSNNNSKFDGFRAFELVDWLKTLKPQNHWKPTEQQLFDMEYIMTHYPNIRGMVESVYNELKKL